MKKILPLSLAALLCALTLSAQNPGDVKFKFVEASDLTMVGKMMPTPNPYQRVDTTVYKGWDKVENLQVRVPTGVAIAFRTNSPIISVSFVASEWQESNTTMRLSSRGFDLYVRDAGGKWDWAGAVCPRENPRQGPMKASHILCSYMGSGMRDCLMYLPIYTDLTSLKIGVSEESTLEAIPNPFRHRILFYGSSFTHGISTSRPGMNYPSQFERHTGLQAVSLGMSGHCKMQQAAINVLKDVKDVDAFVFDTFSNPTGEQIRERLFHFIEEMQEAHPGVPLIFQQTIFMEKASYNADAAKRQQQRVDAAEELMPLACKKYKDVYFIHPNATVSAGESTVDGVHPDDYGYYLWSKSIEKPVLRILRKYGIR